MKKRDILGMIRLDLERKKKPKKKLDDFMLGDEDQHEEIMKAKREPEERKDKKKAVIEEQVGMTKLDEAATKPVIRQLDWGALSKMPMRDQNISLKREYISLLEKLEEASTNTMKEKGTSSEKSIQIEKYKREMKILRDFLRALVEFIPDGYDLKVQMDTTAWEVSEVESEILAKMKSLISKIKFTDKIIEEETKKVAAQKQFLENELIRAKERIKDLESMLLSGTQVQSGVTEQAETVSTSVDVKPVATNVVASDSSRNEKPEYFQMSTEPERKVPNPFEVKKEPTIYTGSAGGDFVVPEIPDEVPKYIFLEVDRYLEDFSEESKLVLQVIGDTGVSRNTELKNEMEKLETGKKYFFPHDKFEYGYLNNAVKVLKDRQFISAKEVNLGARGYKFLVYELTDIGKAVYYKYSKKQPVESEMSKMLADHKSLEHGYLIREVANEFRAKAYTVYEDRETCTYKLENNKRKVFDLIVEKNGEKQHIEVERGTHNDDDFFKAMDKIYQVTTEFYFVAPNEKTLYQVTKGKVFKWITDRLGGFENAKGKMKMHFSTLEKIKKSDEPWEVFAL